MPELEPQCMQWPFRMAGFNQDQIPFVEQDSPAEILQCVGLVLSIAQGELVDEPQLGLPDPSFRIGGVSEATILAVIERWEPRAPINFTRDELIDFVQTIDLETERPNGS